MKVVFLDFDGVININGSFSPAAIKNLSKLLEKDPELKIIVSSSWRHNGLKFVKDTLSKEGIDKDRVVDTTDSTQRDDRGHHIERWIQDHKPEAFVILDEAQNSRPDQMKMFLTRMGFDSKVVVIGDVTQSDLPSAEVNGLSEANKVLGQVPEIKFIHLTSEDTVRHELVQKIIEAYGKSNNGHR